MKILVFSDSHTDVGTMRDITGKEQPEMIFHLGDHYADAQALGGLYPDIPLHHVLGNTDDDYGGKAEQLLELFGKTFLLTHGDLFDVTKAGSGAAALFAKLFLYGKQKGIDMIFFGHTHEPFIYCCDGLWLMNPGRIGRKARQAAYGVATYGILNISENQLRCEIVEV